MTKLQSLADASQVIKAIERNSAEFLLALGRAGDGEEKDTLEIHWIIGGSPIDYHNCVVRASLTPDTADAAIKEMIERLSLYSVSGTWHLSPSMSPPDLKARLTAHGFTHGGVDKGMAADLHTLNEAITFPVTLVIERVRDEDALEVWAQTLAQGFGEGKREAKWVRNMYREIGLGDDTAWRHYLGKLAGTPVATTSMFLTPDVAGIYFVMTVPQARRQGIGAMITLAALREARELGYRVAVLGASEAGYPVYERLGFRNFCDIDIYEWRPPGS
jgi:GNAT superfamily N-acetyltransferase